MHYPTLFKLGLILRLPNQLIQEVQVITNLVEGNLLEEEVEADPTAHLEIGQHVNFATSMGMQ